MALTKPTPIRNDIPVQEVAFKEQSEMVRVNFEVEKATRSAWKAEGFCRSKGLRLKSACVARLFKRPVSRTGWQRTRLCLVGSTALF